MLIWRSQSQKEKEYMLLKQIGEQLRTIGHHKMTIETLIYVAEGRDKTILELETKISELENQPTRL